MQDVFGVFGFERLLIFLLVIVRKCPESCGGSAPRMIMKTGKRQKTDNTREADLELIGEFADALFKQHFAKSTVHAYQRCLNKAARFFHSHRQRLDAFERKHVPMIIEYGSRRTGFSQKMMLQALRAWLRFRGKYPPPVPPAPWQQWLDEYAAFLKEQRGFIPATCSKHLKNAHRFLLWVAGRKPFDWRSVDSKIIFRYAMALRRCEPGVRGLNTRLSYLRQLLRYAHVRGVCSASVAESVPQFSERGRVTNGDTATERELRVFLNSFKPRTPLMTRDYAMALCMLDLGLRCVEVVRLRLADVNFKNMTLGVPPAKGGRGRLLPIPKRVASALRDYLRVRPASDNDACFVRITHLVGRPVACTTVHAAIVSACRRCGFARCGTHWLRRSFATRLNGHGAGLKQIADLLGHRMLKTTAIYTHANTRDLEALVRPWPR